MDHLKLTADKLSVEAIMDLVSDSSCGAVATFVGKTTDHLESKKVLQLVYDVYEPTALKAMKSICSEMRNKWPDLQGIAIYHRLGEVPCGEVSVVVAVSSPRRQDALEAVSQCIDEFDANVQISKRGIYQDAVRQWNDNSECPLDKIPRTPRKLRTLDKSFVMPDVRNEEIKQRIQRFIDVKREQLNRRNIRDFIDPGPGGSLDDPDTCARVRTRCVLQKGAKGYVRIRRVHNEWGPQTAPPVPARAQQRAAESTQAPEARASAAAGLPFGVAERVLDVEQRLRISHGHVTPDVYQRLKLMEDKLAQLESAWPEHEQYWKTDEPACACRCGGEAGAPPAPAQPEFTAQDIGEKIALLEQQILARKNAGA